MAHNVVKVWTKSILNIWRIWIIPVLFLSIKKADREFIEDEVRYWHTILNIPYRTVCVSTIELLLKKREFRNLLGYRLSKMGYRVFNYVTLLLFPGERTLVISANQIGPRLFIQHGFATYIAADTIGSNCWINQQVTIGYDVDNPVPPIICNGVRIAAGAKVIGNVVMGNNSIAAANAVVVKDVNENEVVGGIPAKRISMNLDHKLWKE